MMTKTEIFARKAEVLRKMMRYIDYFEKLCAATPSEENCYRKAGIRIAYEKVRLSEEDPVMIIELLMANLDDSISRNHNRYYLSIAKDAIQEMYDHIFLTW